MHSHYNYCLQCKLAWSKNVKTEQDCPFQILFGAMDPYYCTQIGLAAHIEASIERHGISEMVFDFGKRGRNAYKNANAFVSHTLRKKVFINAEFLEIFEGGKVGHHSNRKRACTMCRNRGCSKDDVDYRGRWKSRKRQQDTYTEDLSWPDINVAAALCMGGACKYVIKDKGNVTDNFILDYVVPHIASTYPKNVALVLGRALLWRYFSMHREKMIIANVWKHICNGYSPEVQGNLDENKKKVGQKFNF